MDVSTTKFQPPSIPRDSEGYVKSFIISSYDCPEGEEAREFFQKYGFVVIANVFTPEQCEETISDIWNVIESFVGKSVRNDENLWSPQYVFYNRSNANFDDLLFLEYGIEQVSYRKVLLVMLVYGHDKFCSIDKLQLYIMLTLLFLEQKNFLLIMIVMGCLDLLKNILNVKL